jgi:hypothetical protein
MKAALMFLIGVAVGWVLLLGSPTAGYFPGYMARNRQANKDAAGAWRLRSGARLAARACVCANE